MGQNQHVVPHGDGWAVRGAGNERVTSPHSTQAEAPAGTGAMDPAAMDVCPGGGGRGARDPAPAIAILVVAPDQRGDLSLCGMGRARSRFPGRR